MSAFWRHEVAYFLCMQQGKRNTYIHISQLKADIFWVPIPVSCDARTVTDTPGPGAYTGQEPDVGCGTCTKVRTIEQGLFGVEHQSIGLFGVYFVEHLLLPTNWVERGRRVEESSLARLLSFLGLCPRWSTCVGKRAILLRI